MSDIKYTAIIVVYNKTIQGSVTCESIKTICDLNIEIVIVDNSENDFHNEELCKSLGYTYISMNGNKGLSKAYNAAIDATLSDIIILFDDDTNVSNEYFKILDEAVKNNPSVDIFAPIVYGQDGIIYSPNEFNFLKNKFIKTPSQKVNHQLFNAIASCLAMRRRIFEGYRFDETLFVDQVDQYFFCEQRALGRKFMKIEAEIQQNFYQRDKVLNPNNAWKRVRLRLIDVMRHARLMHSVKYKFLGFIKCCGLSLQIAKKSKSLIVLIKGLALSVKLFFIIPKEN